MNPFGWTVDEWVIATAVATILVTLLLIYVTLLSMDRSLMEVLSMIAGRSGNVGRHSHWQQRERAKDTHKHVTGEGRCSSVRDCMIALEEERRDH